MCSGENETRGERRSAIQLQVKIILNQVQSFVGFVYQEVRLHCSQGRAQSIEITVKPHGGIRGRCSRWRRPAPGYDRLPQRRWLFVPLGGIPTHFRYAPRRVVWVEPGGVGEVIAAGNGNRRIKRP